jgi:predicted ribonuclease YlaK
MTHGWGRRAVWKGRLEETASALEKLSVFASRPGFIFVPDTSGLIEGPALLDFPWHELVAFPEGETARLVVPILVVEELDELKRHRDAERRRRARQTLRALWELPRDGSGVAQIGPSATLEVLLDDPSHARMPVPDVEIVDRARYLHEITGREVALVAADLAILFRAREMGLRACLIEPSGVRVA